MREPPPRFKGPVELDETYIGGQRRNQRLHIRKRYPPRRGHGTRKLPIFGLFDRASGMACVEVLPRKLDVRHVRERVLELVEPGAPVFTDCFPPYRALARFGYQHQWVNHNQGEYARGAVHTNNIEGLWGILKRTMGCIGGMRRDRLHLFVAEIVWRFNHRKEPLEIRETKLWDLLRMH